MKIPLLAILTIVPCLAVAQSSPSVSTTSTSTITSTTSSTDTTHRDSHRSPKEQLAWLTTKLGLSATQQGQIGPVLDSKDTEMNMINGNTSLSEGEKQDKMGRESERSDYRIESYLTPIQVTQFQALGQPRDKVSVQE
jgi:hypothetical protein